MVASSFLYMIRNGFACYPFSSPYPSLPVGWLAGSACRTHAGDPVITSPPACFYPSPSSRFGCGLSRARCSLVAFRFILVYIRTKRSLFCVLQPAVAAVLVAPETSWGRHGFSSRVVGALLCSVRRQPASRGRTARVQSRPSLCSPDRSAQMIPNE